VYVPHCVSQHDSDISGFQGLKQGHGRKSFQARLCKPVDHATSQDIGMRDGYRETVKSQSGTRRLVESVWQLEKGTRGEHSQWGSFQAHGEERSRKSTVQTGHWHGSSPVTLVSINGLLGSGKDISQIVGHRFALPKKMFVWASTR
jgi:hypothetical protein